MKPSCPTSDMPIKSPSFFSPVQRTSTAVLEQRLSRMSQRCCLCQRQRSLFREHSTLASGTISCSSAVCSGAGGAIAEYQRRLGMQMNPALRPCCHKSQQHQLIQLRMFILDTNISGYLRMCYATLETGPCCENVEMWHMRQ